MNSEFKPDPIEIWKTITDPELEPVGSQPSRLVRFCWGAVLASPTFYISLNFTQALCFNHHDIECIFFWVDVLYKSCVLGICNALPIFLNKIPIHLTHVIMSKLSISYTTHAVHFLAYFLELLLVFHIFLMHALPLLKRNSRPNNMAGVSSGSCLSP
jgi:hypothetical protein